MARDLSTPAAVYVGASVAIGFSSIIIAIVEHKRSTEKVGRVPKPTEKLRPVDLLLLGGAIFYTVYTSSEIWQDVKNLGSELAF